MLQGSGKDTDAESDALTAVLVSPPANGSFAFNATGSFDYTPFADFSGADTFTYRPDDGFTTGSLATVTINVTNTDDLPTAIDDDYVASKNTTLVRGPSLGAIANDLHPDGAARVTLLSEDFETLPLQKYATAGLTPSVSGLDWTSALPTGWSRQVRHAARRPCPGIQGWRIHNVDSWFSAYRPGPRCLHSRRRPESRPRPRRRR